MAKVNNFIIDHVIRGIMTNKKGEYMWSINQITNPSLNVSLTDTAQAVDALGSPIAEFDRGRSAEFGAENSIFDLGLYAAQMGNEVEEGSATKKIVTPAFEEIEVQGTTDETYALKHTPSAGTVPTSIYLLNGDGTLGKVYASDTAADADKFAYADGTITLPTGLTAGDVLFVMYEYEAESGTSVTADGVNFPKKGRFVMEVLGADVCDQEKLIHAYVIFPNAKLDGNVDYSFTTDGTHPFTIKALQDYCDSKKKLFSIVIPDEA
jgi:hypothetical protein